MTKIFDPLANRMEVSMRIEETKEILIQLSCGAVLDNLFSLDRFGYNFVTSMNARMIETNDRYPVSEKQLFRLNQILDRMKNSGII